MARTRKPLPREPIRQLPDGRWRAVVDVAPIGAPRKQKTSTHPTLPEARAWVTATQSTRGQAQPAAPTRETITQLAGRWLARPDVRTITIEGNRHALAPVLRRVGHYDVTNVTVRDVADLTAALTRGGGRRGGPLSPRSVRACIGALAQTLDVAAAEGTIPTNPARSPAVKLPRNPRAPVAHWDVEQLRAFVAAGDGDRWAPIWRLVASGLTRADICGLTWPDVDTDTGLVTVTQGRVQLDHGSTVDDPKSKARRRTLPVDSVWPGTSAMLRGLRATHAADKLRLGSAYRGADFVALHRGAPIRPQLLSERFALIAAAAGLPPIRLHAVRHTLAKMTGDIGLPLAWRAAFLGHTQAVHLAVYSPSGGDTEVARVAAALGTAVAQ